MLQLASPEIALETNLKIVKVTFVSVFLLLLLLNRKFNFLEKISIDIAHSHIWLQKMKGYLSETYLLKFDVEIS